MWKLSDLDIIISRHRGGGGGAGGVHIGLGGLAILAILVRVATFLVCFKKRLVSLVRHGTLETQVPQPS